VTIRPDPPMAMDLAGAGDGRTNALGLLLLSMADDEFVIGFSDSEWTGIGPILEEDVAISSIAQDELGHAQALYTLLADVVADGRDADAIAYDRPPEGYLHARLLDHPRGDWAATIVRRYLYDTADAARLEALVDSSHRPLAELVAKLRREERYHLMHIETWLERLARAPGEPRDRLLAALADMGPDAGTVLAPLPGEPALVRHGIIAEPFASVEARWRATITPTFVRLELPMPPLTRDPERARTDHGDDFRHLHAEFTMVRRSEVGATW
jgi:ring-1,2-phenylacetyl-CoA epoxidase subunit PaaC